MGQLVEVNGKLVMVDGQLLTINNNIARLTSKSVATSAPDKELEGKVNEIASNLMDTIITLQEEINELKQRLGE